MRTWAQGEFNNFNTGNPDSVATSFNFTNIPDDFNTEPDVVYGFDGNLFALGNEALNVLVTDDRRAEFVFSSDSAQAIFTKADDLPSLFANWSLSLTNMMRQTGSSTLSTRYAGEALTQEVYFKVAFVWLLFPACLVTFSAVLLVLSVGQARRCKVPAWKDNALSVLFVGVDLQLRNRLSETTPVEEAVKRVKKQKVLLREDEHRWTLSE